MIGPDDVMPMLLEAVPSFSEQWSEIEDDPIFLDETTGRGCTTSMSPGSHRTSSNFSDPGPPAS